ncbi:DUF3850 domain-containing protein [Providencia sp. 504mA]|nr:DUF3850 domain-containing protein [Providencia rettgeri]NIA97679.1 DUF3850 domain-containing protein [Providencia rettgeri]NIB15208.1 DUF3850 domain-containing protein [Providencia rettgeri]NIB35420.1 DUF3850 domain-containing protein [Providencia rettgeri]NIL71409.1 DUF3850 domain-containing protein [Providencia sp. 504mA]
MTMKRKHELKLAPHYFQLVQDGLKTAEFRRDDRDFQVGDELFLREFNSINKPYASYTGNAISCLITDITKVNEVYPELRALPPFVMISFSVIRIEDNYRG